MDSHQTGASHFGPVGPPQMKAQLRQTTLKNLERERSLSRVLTIYGVLPPGPVDIDESKTIE